MLTDLVCVSLTQLKGAERAVDVTKDAISFPCTSLGAMQSVASQIKGTGGCEPCLVKKQQPEELPQDREPMSSIGT